MVTDYFHLELVTSFFVIIILIVIFIVNDLDWHLCFGRATAEFLLELGLFFIRKSDRDAGRLSAAVGLGWRTACGSGPASGSDWHVFRSRG